MLYKLLTRSQPAASPAAGTLMALPLHSTPGTPYATRCALRSHSGSYGRSRSPPPLRHELWPTHHRTEKCCRASYCGTVCGCGSLVPIRRGQPPFARRGCRWAGGSRRHFIFTAQRNKERGSGSSPRLLLFLTLPCVWLCVIAQLFSLQCIPL
jgi:hypothetical protein